MTRNSIQVEDMVLSFPGQWEVEDFDAWYGSGAAAKPLTNSPFKAKDCDVLALSEGVLWLIEVKDYTYPGKKIPEDLHDTFALKVFHTLARLMSVAHFGQHDRKNFCRRAINAKEIRVALAIESRGDDRKLLIALAGLKDRLEKGCRPMGITRVTVSNSRIEGNGVEWSQKRSSEARLRHSDR